MNSDELWHLTFLAAIISGKTVKKAREMADEALEINRDIE